MEGKKLLLLTQITGFCGVNLMHQNVQNPFSDSTWIHFYQADISIANTECVHFFFDSKAQFFPPSLL